MSKLSFFIFLFCITLVSQAQIVTFACPAVNSFTYSTAAADTYQVQAFVTVVSGNTPAFLMQGSAQTKAAVKFVHASFKRGEFSCAYASKNALSFAIQLTNEATFGLEYCYFNHASDPRHCAGNASQCTLSCDML